MRVRSRPAAVAVILAAGLAACATGGDPGTPSPRSATVASPPSTAPSAARVPDVIDAELEVTGERWRVAATISSPYDSPERYADAFRVLAPDGAVLGVRELLHDHADEQPFTRTLDDVDIPGWVDEVVVEARDLAHGWGGGTVTIEVPR